MGEWVRKAWFFPLPLNRASNASEGTGAASNAKRAREAVCEVPREAMPFRIVECATCDRCGEVFEGKDPKRTLWVHENKSKTPCDEKRKRKELDEWKRTVTVDDLAEFKRLKAQDEYRNATADEVAEFEAWKLRREGASDPAREVRRSYVYALRLVPEDRLVYVGRTCDPSRRLREHGRSSSECRLVRDGFALHGAASFRMEILAECSWDNRSVSASRVLDVLLLCQIQSWCQ